MYWLANYNLNFHIKKKIIEAKPSTNNFGIKQNIGILQINDLMNRAPIFKNLLYPNTKFQQPITLP